MPCRNGTGGAGAGGGAGGGPAYTTIAFTGTDMLSFVAAGPQSEPTQFITGGDDRTAYCFDYATGAQVYSWQGHKRCVNRAHWSDKARGGAGMLATASRDMTVRVWAGPSSPGGEGAGGGGGAGGADGTQDALREFKGHELTVSSVQAVPTDGRWVASGSRDTTVRIWDVETGKQVMRGQAPRNLVTCMSWMPNEETIVQGSEDLKVRLWDPRAGTLRCTSTWEGYVYFPLCLDVSPDEHSVLTSSKGFGGVGCEAKLWDTRKGQVVREFVGHQQDAVACCWLSNVDSEHPLFATASKDETIRVWDSVTGAVLSETRDTGSGAWTGLAQPHAGGEAGLLASGFAPALFAYKVGVGGNLERLARTAESFSS